MRVELMPGALDVLRFPLERRVPPSLRLWWKIAPEMDLLHVVEASMAGQLREGAIAR